MPCNSLFTWQKYSLLRLSRWNRSCLSLCLFFFTLSACSDFFSYSSGETAKSINSDKADALFKETETPRFQLSFDDSSWNWLQENALLKEYVPAELKIDGKAIGKVGVRYKGQTGTLISCFTNGVRNEKCPRLSLKIKFDKYDDNLKYLGLKRLKLHSLKNDKSLLRERISYSIFYGMNLPTPRASYAMVSINQGPYGLYGMLENIDKRFLKTRQPQDYEGNLYKSA